MTTANKSKRLTKSQKKKYEQMIRDIVIIRDDNRCQLKGINHVCNGRLVADHTISRRHMSTFFDIRNLTAVCMAANLMLNFDAYLRHCSNLKVIEREGENILEELNALKKTPKTKKFTVDELEALVKTYKDRYAPEDKTLGEV